MTAHRLGVVYIAPFDVILEETSVVVPDLLFVVQDRVGIVTDPGVRGASDLIVEILSPGTARRDRVERAKLYAKHGVRHYWLADPEARVLEVYELSEGRYRRSAGQAGGDVFSPSLFPGLTIPLASLWG